MAIKDISTHIDEKIKKSFENMYQLSEDNDILDTFMEVGTSTDYSKGYTSVEWVEAAEFFDETGALKKANLPEGYKVVSEAQEYGRYMETTKKEMLNTKDEGTLFDSYESKKIPALIASLNYLRRKTAFELLNKWILAVWASGVKNAPDAKPIFGEHKFKSSTVTFNNKTNLKAGEKALDFLEEFAWNLKDSQWKPMACDFNLIIVKKGGEAAKRFRKALYKDWMKATKIADVNIYNDWKYSVMETQYIENWSHWFAFDTSKDRPFILDDIQKPTLDPKDFDNINQKIVHSATGSMRVVCANLPFYVVGSTGEVE